MRSAWPKIILFPASFIYRIAVFFWDIFWRYADTVRLPAKVISVGNITVGGTGKTPLTILLAEAAVKAGLRTAVIARGYRRSGKGLIELSPETTWAEAGDEPLEIYRAVKGLRVYVCRSKTTAAKQAVKDGAEIIIIDDGFQHRRLHRDIDVVCLDWAAPLGPGGFLPYGFLREPPAALRRADIILYTSYNKQPAAKAEVQPTRKRMKQFWAKTIITGFINIQTGEKLNTEQMREKVVLAFCGLARPVKFKESLQEIGLSLRHFLSLPDHYGYRQQDIDILLEAAAAYKADTLLTTGKDAVKIEHLNFGGFNIYSCQMRMEITDQLGKSLTGRFMKELGI